MMSALIPLAFLLGGMFTVGFAAYTGELNLQSDTLMLQVVAAFVLWPLLLPVMIGLALRRRSTPKEDG